jgi:hypothetical protein
VSSVADDRRLPGPAPRELERAASWLARELERAGGRMASNELSARADAAGITFRTLRRARAARGVLAERVDGRWFAVLPAAPEVPDA